MRVIFLFINEIVYVLAYIQINELNKQLSTFDDHVVELPAAQDITLLRSDRILDIYGIMLIFNT